MTAAAALADVVQDAAQVEPHRIAYLAHQLGRERQLGAVAPALDPPQLLDQEQRVNVDGVRVVHVLLPHTDQVRELGQVGAEQPDLVHALQRAVDAGRRGQDLAEERARLGIGAERVVDPVQVLAHQPLRARRELDVVVLRDREGGEQAHGPLLDQRRRGNLEPPGADREALGDRVRALWPAPLARQLARVVDHPLAHALDRARVQVVRAHQHLDPAQRILGREAQVLGELLLRLVVEPVVLAALAVELVAHAPQEVERRQQLALLVGVDEALHAQVLGAAHFPERRARDPERGVEVAQAADALLQVRLQQVERLAEVLVALGLLGELARR